MSAAASGRQTATVVTNTRVRDGLDEEFEAWQGRINQVISRLDGFVSSEVLPPTPPDQLDWVIIQRFERPDQLKAWLESPQRAEMLAQIRPALEGEDAVNVFVGHDAESGDAQGPVTAVIMTNVTPGNEKAFERWHARVKQRQSTYPGFLGCEVQLPTGAGTAVRWGGPAVLVCLYAVSIVFFHFFTGWVHITPIASL